MAVSAYEVISTQTLGSAASSVTFSSIPQTYTDLVLIINHSITTGNPSIHGRFNSDASSIYSRTRIFGNGSATSSGRATTQTFLGLSTAVGSSTTVEGIMICNILNYANATTFKTCITRNDAASLGVEASVTLWRNTAAVSTFEVFPDTSTFTAGSTFTLYGIKAA